VNKETSHYVRLFGVNKIGKLIFLLPLVQQRAMCLQSKPGLSLYILPSAMCLQS
jgi:hypothetical protein